MLALLLFENGIKLERITKCGQPKAEEQNIFLSPTDKLSVGHHWQKTESDCFGMDVDC
jgi:hypothetical protein